MSTRERILDAAAAVMREHGVAHATTKQIARTAGYSEALLYKHFHDKEDILLHVLQERMPAFTATAAAGEGTVEVNLVEVAHSALRYAQRPQGTGGALGSIFTVHRPLLKSFT